MFIYPAKNFYNIFLQIPADKHVLLAVRQTNSHKIHIKDQIVKYDRSQRVLKWVSSITLLFYIIWSIIYLICEQEKVIENNIESKRMYNIKLCELNYVNVNYQIFIQQEKKLYLGGFRFRILIFLKNMLQVN